VAVLTPGPAVHAARSLEEAVVLLSDPAGDVAALAGGTWIMRAPLRDERRHALYVSLRGVPELRACELGGGVAVLGALLTHAELAALDGAPAALRSLVEAAGRSAFPAVRTVATLGGNVCSPFPEADLVPALLAAGAELNVAGPDGGRTVDLAGFLEGTRRGPGDVVVAARVPVPAGRRSAFERLTVRGSGEYAIASVAVSADLDDDGAIVAARVAYGGVETTARRSSAAEAALRGGVPTAEAGYAAGRAAAADLTAREGLDAPGWYRLEVLPALTRTAVARLADPDGRGEA
jgi:carbon-monoxide dehydrogenase medium subunit